MRWLIECVRLHWRVARILCKRLFSRRVLLAATGDLGGEDLVKPFEQRVNACAQHHLQSPVLPGNLVARRRT